MADAAAFSWIMVAAAVTLAVITDLRNFRIPNALTLPLLLSGLAFSFVTQGLPGLVISSAGAIVGFLVLLPLYLVGGMGAGDIKLMAGVGAWLKTARTLDVLVVSCLLTGLISILLLWRRRWAESRASSPFDVRPSDSITAQDNSSTSHANVRVEDVVHAADRRIRLIPFGVMVGMGLMVTWVRSIYL